VVEPDTQDTVGNVAYGYQKSEAELLPLWGGLEHPGVSMEPYQAVRGA
jgi:hypothetical protein